MSFFRFLTLFTFSPGETTRDESPIRRQKPNKDRPFSRDDALIIVWCILNV